MSSKGQEEALQAMMNDLPSYTIEPEDLTSSKRLKELSEPPSLSLSLPEMTFVAEDEAEWLSVLRERKEFDDFARYELLLRAEEVRLQRDYHRLLCEEGALGALNPYHFDAVRQMIRQFRGRALLAHGPYFFARTELILAIQEYLDRGLLQRILIVAPRQHLPFWQFELQVRTGLSFEIAFELPEEPLPLLLLSAELLEVPIRLDFMKNADYSLLVVEGAERLAQRRSRFWRNIQSLASSHLFLQTILPFSEHPSELYGLLSLLEVPELPSPRAFREKMGGMEAPITPAMRRAIRPYLEAVTLRHSEATSVVETSNVQWRFHFCEPSSIALAWQGKFRRWFHALLKSEEDSLWALSNLWERSLSSVAALESSLRERGKEAAELLDDAAIAQRHDCRFKMLLSILESTKKATILIFSHFEETRESIVTFLENSGIQRLQNFVFTDAKASSEEPRRQFILATDFDIPPQALNADRIVFFDLPWDPIFWLERAHLLDSLQQDSPSTIQIILPESSLLQELFDTLDFRLDLKTLQRLELSLIFKQLPEKWHFDKNWPLLIPKGQRSTFFEELSLQLLQAKKAYRQKIDLNERLLLDDYTT